MLFLLYVCSVGVSVSGRVSVGVFVYVCCIR